MKQPEHKGINLIGNKAYPMRYALLLSYHMTIKKLIILIHYFFNKRMLCREENEINMYIGQINFVLSDYGRGEPHHKKMKGEVRKILTR